MASRDSRAKKRGSWRLLAALTVGAALILSACGTGGSGGSGGGEVEDELGVIEIGPNEPITLGYILVVTGPNESLGIDSRNGIEIAIEDKGEVLGHKIELTGEDDGCGPEGGQAAATKIANNPKIVAVIGTNCSSAARAAIPIITQAGLTMVSPSATAPDLTAADRPADYAGFARTAHNDRVQGRVAAEYAFKVAGAKTAATIHDGSLYAEKLTEVFRNNFEKLGGTITNAEAVDENADDMKPVLTTIAANKPDFIYFPIFLPAGGHIIRQAREFPELANTKLMVADGLFSPDVARAAGEAVDGVLASSPFVSGPDYDAFLQKHKDKYGGPPPSVFHAHAYDATMIILSAIEKVAVKRDDGSLVIGKKALRDAIFATKDFKGLTGTLTCNVNDEAQDKFPGDCGDPHIAVYQYTKAQAEDPATNWPPQKIWP